MNKAPVLKEGVSPEKVQWIMGYQRASGIQSFMDELNKLYRDCRKKAQEGFEKNDPTAAYWSGRADSYEVLLDNCKAAEKADLRKVS